ncbi:MAG: hypothetical protein KF738_08170 [Burkholderiales bacterium]|nr:hypothetical protein [Burkholderiales bacterium]
MVMARTGIPQWTACALALALAVAEAQGVGVDAETRHAARPDFSGDWMLDAGASDDPRKKAREAWQESRQSKGAASGHVGAGMPGRGKGRSARAGGVGQAGARDDDALPAAALSALPEPAMRMRVTHQDPALSIADERDRRQQLHTGFRGASVSAIGGLHQRVATAGWEGGVLVIETAAIGLRLVEHWRIDGRTGHLVIDAKAEVFQGQPVPYRLVYAREAPPAEHGGGPQSDNTHSRTTR